MTTNNAPIFGRVVKLVQSRLNSTESKDPMRAYDRAIGAKRRELAKLREVDDRVVQLEAKLGRDVFEQRADIARIHDEARAAARRSDDRTALRLLERKQTMHDQLNDAEEALTHYCDQARQARTKLRVFEDEIRALEREKNSSRALIAQHEARIKLQSALQNAREVRQDVSLEVARRRIAELDAEASLNDELDEDVLDAELGPLFDDVAATRAQAELRRLKRDNRRRLSAVCS